MVWHCHHSQISHFSWLPEKAKRCFQKHFWQLIALKMLFSWPFSFVSSAVTLPFVIFLVSLKMLTFKITVSLEWVFPSGRLICNNTRGRGEEKSNFSHRITTFTQHLHNASTMPNAMQNWETVNTDRLGLPHTIRAVLHFFIYTVFKTRSLIHSANMYCDLLHARHVSRMFVEISNWIK